MSEAVVLPVRTIGVMGDYRTYDYVVGLRAVTSTDGMTADFYPFDMKFLAHVATRIVNEVKGVNRVEALMIISVGTNDGGVLWHGELPLCPRPIPRARGRTRTRQ